VFELMCGEKGGTKSGNYSVTRRTGLKGKLERDGSQRLQLRELREIYYEFGGGSPERGKSTQEVVADNNKKRGY